MVRFLFDEDLNHHIIRGLVRRLPGLEATTAIEARLLGHEDGEILACAARERRLVVSHDVHTMSAAFRQRINAGLETYGLLLVPRSLPIGRVIEDLELVSLATEPEDWVGVLDFLPL